MPDTKALTRTDRTDISRRGDGASSRPQVSIDGVENALLQGDLSRLSPQERLSYYEKVCTSVGLNPLTRPFEYIKLNGKLTLYAKKDATEQLRRINGVSITEMETDRMQDVYLVRVHAVDKDGRTDVATGAVPIKGASGDRLANALMKAETKAKRRVTLSIVGLGWLDETELDTIPSAETVTVDHETGEIKESDDRSGGPPTEQHPPHVDPEERARKEAERTAKVARLIDQMIERLTGLPDEERGKELERIAAYIEDWPAAEKSRVVETLTEEELLLPPDHERATRGDKKLFFADDAF